MALYVAGDDKYISVACQRSRLGHVLPRRRAASGTADRCALHKLTEARRKHRDVLEDIIAALFKEHAAAVWLKRLEAARLPYGSVNSIGEVLAHPQLAARGMIQDIDSPVGRVPVLATPLRLSDLAAASRSRPRARRRQ